MDGWQWLAAVEEDALDPEEFPRRAKDISDPAAVGSTKMNEHNKAQLQALLLYIMVLAMVSTVVVGGYIFWNKIVYGIAQGLANFSSSF